MVGEPSLISTIAAGAFCPSAPGGSAAIASSALSIASPVAVPPPIVQRVDRGEHRGVIRRSARRGRARVLSNDNSPTFRPAGRPSTKRRAAACAATQPARRDVGRGHRTRRVDREHDRCRAAAATFFVRVGRAKPSTSAATAASISTAETWRCQPGRRGATDASRSTLVKRSAYLRRDALRDEVRDEQRDRRDQDQRAATVLRSSRNTPQAGRAQRVLAAASATCAGAAVRRPATKRTISISQSRVGGQHEVLAAGVADLRGRSPRGVPARRRRNASRSAAEFDCTWMSRPGLGVDEREHARGGKRELAAVDDLDAQHLVREREPRARRVRQSVSSRKSETRRPGRGAGARVRATRSVAARSASSPGVASRRGTSYSRDSDASSAGRVDVGPSRTTRRRRRRASRSGCRGAR